MVKRITALALVLALVCGLSSAFAWSCPSCGNEMGANFCTECGTRLAEAAPAPTAAPTAVPTPEPTAAPADPAQGPEISSIMGNEDGSASLVWNGQMGHTYQVRYLIKQNADNSIGYYYAESTLGVYTLDRLVPGESCWIGVFDEAGNGYYEAFTPEAGGEPFHCL